MAPQAQLRIVPEGTSPFGDRAEKIEPVGVANSAVPLLWLAMFNYDDTSVQRVRSIDVFASAVPVEQAKARVEVLITVAELAPPRIAQAAKLLRNGLKQHSDGSVVLYPGDLFADFDKRSARTYSQQLIHLCEIWERFRDGEPWEKTLEALAEIQPNVVQVLEHVEPRIANYSLVGSFDQFDEGLAAYVVTDGAGPKDLEPEALVVGEQGLLLGRFDSQWKLMSSGVEQDLTAVWGTADAAFIVGHRGTIVTLQEGVCSTMASPTTAHLSAIWGVAANSACAVGDGGTVIAYNGQTWQPWPVPSEAPLTCVTGTDLDNIYIGGQDSFILHFDGFSWNREALPIEGVVNRIIIDDDEVVRALGGSRFGGEIFIRTRDGWQRDENAPRTQWFEHGWIGWGNELGIAMATTPVISCTEGVWSQADVPLTQITCAYGGATAMVTGVIDDYAALLNRVDGHYRIETTLRGLQFNAVWVGGRPKPPRKRALDDNETKEQPDPVEAA